MTGANDPVRWSERADSALPEELLRGFAQYAQQGPSETERARMAERLSADVARSASSFKTSATTRAWLKWVGAAGVVIGLGLATLFTRPAMQTETRVATAAAPMATVKQTEAPAVVEPTRAEVAAQAVAPLPKLKRRVRPTKVPEQNAPAEAQLLDPTAELRLLAPARQLIAAQPARALELANEHARTFPNGLFAQERQVLIIEALVRTGKRHEAEAAARAFIVRYPQSSYRERVDQAVKEHAQ